MRKAGVRREIILASGSPRRRELLALTGLKFRVVAGDYEEDMTLPFPPRKLARFLSLEKGKAVALKHPGALVIAADTFIYFRGKLLGKPASTDDARKMLRQLSGRPHLVITGYAILDTRTGKTLTKAVGTKVFFRDLADREIDAYVASGEPMDKAGAYAIQGLGSLIVSKIEGDYFNVIGLPLSSLATSLKSFGITVL